MEYLNYVKAMELRKRIDLLTGAMDYYCDKATPSYEPSITKLISIHFQTYKESVIATLSHELDKAKLEFERL